MMNNKQVLVHCVILMCLGQKALGSEIINGEKALPKSFSYMASVQNDGIHVCGGFLVSQDFVLTAAHCDNETFTNMSVVVGTHNLRRTERAMRYNVLKCRHRSFKKVISGSDIMLLKLSRGKKEKTKKWKTVQLPNERKDKTIKAKTKCVVAGWGLTRTGGRVSDDLRVVDVSTIDLKVCQREWRGILPKNGIICAGGFPTDKGFCQGDSGGPLLCNGKAFGIVSFNNGSYCDYPDVPNIYTDVLKYMPWIKKIMKKKTC